MRFVLINSYYLLDEAARGRFEHVEETLDKAARLGARVVRTWAFLDGERPGAMQRAPGVYDEASLAAFERVLDAAGARGLKLILPLCDFWPSYGGVPQYLSWHGLAPTETAKFFVEPALRAHYAEHVAKLLRRWGNHEAVLAWELMNEPRGTGLDSEGEQMADWVAFAAAAVRAQTKRPIAVGDEGFDVRCDDPLFWRRVGGEAAFAPANGISFRKNLAHVDLATCHLFPEKWGWKRGAEREAGARWIADHAALARAANRPLLVEEFGLRNFSRDGRAARPLAERRRAYAEWLEAARVHGALGIGPWMFAYDDRPDGWDDFTFYLHDPPAPVDRYADLVAAAAAALSTEA